AAGRTSGRMVLPSARRGLVARPRSRVGAGRPRRVVTSGGRGPRGDAPDGLDGDVGFVDVEVVLAVRRGAQPAVARHREPLALPVGPAPLQGGPDLRNGRQVLLAVLDHLHRDVPGGTDLAV